jgi:AcrR family transcriptional regulator
MTEAPDVTAVNRPSTQMNKRMRDRIETAKRSALIEASIQVIANCGFHGASVSLIAGHAGVAAGTVYVHFESKEHLVLETYKELERRCLAAVLKDYPSQGTIRQRFFHLGNSLIRHLIRFPEEFLFGDQFLSSPFRKSVSPHYLPEMELRGILQVFREGAEKELFKAMPPAMLLALACGPLIQVVRADTAGYLYLDDERVSKTVEACWEAVSLQKVPYLRRRKEGAKESGSQPRDNYSHAAVGDFLPRRQR